MGAALLALGLVAYNNLANTWPPFHRDAYVPMNVTCATLLVAVGFGALHLSASDMGLDWSRAWVGLLVPGVVTVALATALRMPTLRAKLVDHRLDGVAGSRALYMVGVRIPIGTAALEEIAFRGVLLGAWRPHGAAVAVVLSSAAFGLWHVAPTIDLLDANAVRTRRALWVVAGVALTAVAGAGLAVLRLSTGALAAPFLTHALVNSVAAGASLVARRL